MNHQQRLLTRVVKLIPTQFRQWAKQMLERHTNSARRSFYSDYGEDAFLQSYFRQQAYAAYPGLPLHMYRELVGPGFYVDIGAYSPKLFSTTYWFYRHGWRGINVDPTPGSMEIFRKVRPHDQNIEVAVSGHDGEIKFYCWDKPSPLNTVDPKRAAQLTEELGRSPVELTVSARRLSTLLDLHLPPHQPISFLTVDVEKHDLEVLESNNWQKYRPELLLVECHVAQIEGVIESDTTRFLKRVGYEIYAWTKPTVIYRQANLVDPLVA